MNTTWQFYPQHPTDPIHNPIASEFFSTEAVGNVTEALIREGIQNTLDARETKEDGSQQPANVRVFLSGTAEVLPAARSPLVCDTLASRDGNRQWLAESAGSWRIVPVPRL